MKIHNPRTKYCSLMLMFLLFSRIIFSQENKIEGTVFDLKTKTPVAFASVYLSGTNYGSPSNTEGHFIIPNISPGKYILVVSVIGYSTSTLNITIEEHSSLYKEFYLEPKTLEMNTITVQEKHTSEWMDYLEEFKKYFLGTTELSDECEITNENELILSKNEESALEAKCSNPLIVINNALGYKVECDLAYFRVDLTTVKILYYLNYSELPIKNKIDQTRWFDNREKEYKSSLRYFLKCLIANKTVENGYRLYKRHTQKEVVIDQEMISKNVMFDYAGTYSIVFPYDIEIYNTDTDKASWVNLFGVKTDKDGNIDNPQSVIVGGDFFEKGAANRLPKNYVSLSSQ
jgi:hypothetical protein